MDFRNSLAAVNACRKLAVNLGDSIELRVILSLLYTVTIVLRNHDDDHLRESFISELSRFIVDSKYGMIKIEVSTFSFSFILSGMS